MKRSSFIFGMLLAGTTIFTSCTKDLKEDVKDLQGRVNDVENAIGSNEPMVAKTTLTDFNNATKTIDEAYRFKANGLSTQYMIKNEDGTYDVYIERFSDVEWYEGASIRFTYNLTTKEITDKRVTHYWDDLEDTDNIYYYDWRSNNTITITIEKFDVNSGDVSVKATASATADYTEDYGGPYPGKPVSTTLSFAGKLKKFERED